MIYVKAVAGAFLATYGFSVMFNLKGKNCAVAAYGGAFASLIYTILIYQFNLSEPITMLITSACLSLYCEFAARIQKSPVLIFFMCGIICFVPGGAMYYTMLEIINGNTSMSLMYCLSALAIAGAIAIGVVLSAGIVKLYYSIVK